MEKRGWLADDNGIPWFSDAKQGRGLNRSILHISLGIALDSIWKQSRLDDSLDVVVSFFIANL